MWPPEATRWSRKDDDARWKDRTRERVLADLNIIAWNVRLCCAGAFPMDKPRLLYPAYATFSRTWDSSRSRSPNATSASSMTSPIRRSFCLRIGATRRSLPSSRTGAYHAGRKRSVGCGGLDRLVAGLPVGHIAIGYETNFV